MFNASPELERFYWNHVILGRERRERLAAIRDANLAKLNRGLDDLSAASRATYAHYSQAITQGGFAMHTLNRDPRDEDDYDIDVAVIFEESDLPTAALGARQRVRDALAQRTEHMREPPELRKNAVTLWYQEGYHIDFAIFRRRVEDGREWYEHASVEWARRDPFAVARWFEGQVADLSPRVAIEVAGRPRRNQLRRVVRFLKWFSRSRASWSLPGGMVMTALGVECYVPDANRDDVSLYETLVTLRERLHRSTRVNNPIDPSVYLTDREEVGRQVARLRDQLEIVLPRLDRLFDPGCSAEQARSAWDWIFNHQFWGEERDEELVEARRRVASAALPNRVTIRCQLARGERGQIYDEYRSAQRALPKGVGLRFSLVHTDVPQPYEVVWNIRNYGHEAATAQQLTWSRSDPTECWTSTRFKGLHVLICEVKRHGAVLARATHFVKIKGR